MVTDVHMSVGHAQECLRPLANVCKQIYDASYTHFCLENIFIEAILATFADAHGHEYSCRQKSAYSAYN